MAATHAYVTRTQPYMDTPHDNDPVTLGTVLKYLGMAVVSVFIMVLGWIGKLISRWITKQLESYVKRVEDAVTKVESLSERLDALTRADADLSRRMEVIERQQETLERDVQEIRKSLEKR